jgi:CTP:molybdopterin cytidylyltransferase MocA
MAVALVLAAGEGARLGGPKALLEAAGRTFVARVVDTCRRALVREVIVVAGARADEVRRAVEELPAPEDAEAAPVRVVLNEDWRAGRTGSVQAGWRAAAATDNVLVFPVDHPAVELVTLDVILGVFGYAAAQPDVVIPVLEVGDARRRGHPIVLHQRLRDEVFALGPDSPLNELVRSRPQLLEVPVDDEGILLNVNEPEDLARLEELLAGR